MVDCMVGWQLARTKDYSHNNMSKILSKDTTVFHPGLLCEKLYDLAVSSPSPSTPQSDNDECEE